MYAKINPSIVSGSVKIPPSKSMAHRAIICASLANGTSIISNVAYSKDIIATIEGMRKLGANINTYDDYVVIEGIKDFTNIKDHFIDCNESGSTLRFFIPIFSLCNSEIHFSGAPRLLQRPQSIYQELFHKQNLDFIQNEKEIVINESLKPGKYLLKGDISSQFISGLLFALPLLNQDSEIEIIPPFESKSYVDLTLQMLEIFQVNAYFKDDHTLIIPGNQKYQPCNYTIEGDYSQLAFFAVLAAINNDLEVYGVHHNSKQGDKQIIQILKDFKINIEPIKFGYKIKKGIPIACDIDLSNCPDLGPILCVLGMYAKGTTKIYNAARLRIKESDRIEAMEIELKKLGVHISSTYDEITIVGNDQYQTNQDFDAHNDHRIVMALSVACSLVNQECIIHNAQAINKSYPNFFEDYLKVKGCVTCYD